MLVIRPVTLDDVDGLLELSHLTGFGLTTLPRDRAILLRRVRESNRGFDKADEDPPGGETFFFVLEDTSSGRVVGTTGVTSKVGGFEPFYAYKLESTVQESPMLGVRKRISTLHLVTEHNGPCEIGSLFLHPDHRGGGNGRLLSLSRFLFMGQHPHLFDPLVIAEMRGVIDEHGRSVFWDALGKHFFEIEFPKADYMVMVNKRFIAELMPRHPIYTCLLPPEAQAVIGQVHEQTRPALQILEHQGFSRTDMVDIFEGGPIVSCPLLEIRAVRESVTSRVSAIDDELTCGDWRMAASTRRHMRACRTMVAAARDGGVQLQRDAANALGVSVGDTIRHVATKDGQEGRP